MFKNMYPVFEPKRLLKTNMLENLRDFPRDFFFIGYQNYCNGVLTGTNINTTNDYIYIKPGVLIWNRILYMMTEELKISYDADEITAYLKVKFLETVKNTENQEYLTQIYIDHMPAKRLNEIELARFKLQGGARLRDEYTDFYDYDTEFNTINRIYVPFASPDKPAIWPEILKTFARTMIVQEVSHEWDISFCINCLNMERAMNYEVVKAYLNVRLEERRDYDSNYEVYLALKQVLRIAGGSDRGQARDQRGPKKMLLL